MTEIKRMPIAEFRELGFVHEINRLLLHPLGLALEVTTNRVTGEARLSGVWDGRDNPEGWEFGSDLLSAAKAEYVAGQMFERRRARADALGFVVQPVETEKPTLTTTYINPAERSKG